jgi:hypothetical protein
VSPGIFAEHTWRLFNSRLSWITGLRADFHNQFGAFITPRTLLKYDLTPTTIVRANVGTGWRTVNLFSENIGLLVSSRNLLFAEALEPEQAVNAGINLTQKYSFFNKLLGGYLSIDYYRTEFSNQVFPDYDSDPTKALIANFRGQSLSESFQVEGVMRWQDLIEWKESFNEPDHLHIGFDFYLLKNDQVIAQFLVQNEQRADLETFLTYLHQKNYSTTLLKTQDQSIEQKILEKFQIIDINNLEKKTFFESMKKKENIGFFSTNTVYKADVQFDFLLHTHQINKKIADVFFLKSEL